MRKFLIFIVVVFAVVTSFGVSAHNTGRHEAAPGGPCWIWEVPVTPIYCIFVHGTRHQHPYPEWVTTQ